VPLLVKVGEDVDVSLKRATGSARCQSGAVKMDGDCAI
jgi:hypothetical protein